ncbi:hypothetical protein, partial [Paenibacillus naphthalenovorans]|uniref:hypothetical protein n=1 Tax=Paenibacillus naphthalenovorans TaxID=162209 RepID=UPI001BB2344C
LNQFGYSVPTLTYRLLTISSRKSQRDDSAFCFVSISSFQGTNVFSLPFYRQERHLTMLRLADATINFCQEHAKL